MRTVILALALMVVGTDAVSAQSIGGTYRVSGTNPNGSQYGGTARITGSGANCRIYWQTGATSSEGVCLQSNRSFAAAYILQGQAGLVVYELRPDGSLHGTWTTAGSGVGTESLFPQ